MVPRNPPSVNVVLTSAGHQRSLPQALAKEGLARAVVRMAPDLEILERGPAGDLKVTHRLSSYRLGQRILWAVWWRLPARWRSFVPFQAWSSLADSWISRRLPPSDIFQCPMGVCVESLRRAKSLGAATLVDNPALHAEAFRRETHLDCADAGVRLTDTRRGMRPADIRRCEWQYRMCDKIIVYSRAAARSFEPFSYAAKTVVVPQGVDNLLFAPRAGTMSSDVFRVCFVGRIEAPKGVHRLIDAWKRLSLPDAELLLIGHVMPEIDRLPSLPGGIRLTGILQPEGVVKRLQESHLFVLPSVNEGLSRSLLEAMSCGVPVIACRDTGAEDCVTPGQEGLLVPGRNTEALADALLWCYRHRDDLAAMGRAARTRIEAEFTLSHYAQRLIALYRSVAGR